MPAGQITELPRSAEAELIPPVYEYPRHARVLELRLSAVHSEDDASGTPGLSPETVERDWRFEASSSREMGKYNDAD